MKKKITKSFLALLGLIMFANILAMGQTTEKVVGNGTANGYIPIYPYHNYSYSQTILMPYEVGFAGQITKIKYKFAGSAADFINSDSITLYMGHTTKETFTSNTDWIPISSLTQKFKGKITYLSTNWVEITLSSPFTYNGTSNLAIAVEEDRPDCTASAQFFNSTQVSGGARSIYFHSNTDNPNPASPPTAYSRVSQIPTMNIVFTGAVTPILDIAKVITLYVNAGDSINLQFRAYNANTPVRIVSGNTTRNLVVGTTSSPSAKYYAESNIMKIYGDLDRFECYTAPIYHMAISNNHNIKIISAIGTRLSKGAIDDLYCMLPNRPSSDPGILWLLANTSDTNSAKVLATNSNNAANKNWRVQYGSNNTLIPTTGTFACGSPTVNMNRFITLNLNTNLQHNITRNEGITTNTYVRVISGSLDTTMIPNGTDYFISNSNTITFYGDIKVLDLDEWAGITTSMTLNNDVLEDFYIEGVYTSLDFSGAPNIKILNVGGSNLRTIDISALDSLNEIGFSYANFSPSGIDSIYCALPNRTGLSVGKVYASNSTTDSNHPDVLLSNKTNATTKNWNVYVGSSTSYTNPTNGTYVCGGTINTGDVLTLAALDITTNSAKLRGAAGGMTYGVFTGSGFEWKETNGGTYTDLPSSTSLGAHTKILTGLSPNTSYTYRAYGIYNGVKKYGTEVTFTTLPVPVAATVTTNAASGIAQTLATLNGVVAPGTDVIAEKGFEWKLTTGGTYADEVSASTGNTFTASLTNLTSNTSYTFRAYVKVGTTKIYGTTKTFTTQIIPVAATVTTNDATDVGQTTATLNGLVNPGTDVIAERGFEWKLTTGGTYADEVSSSTGNTFTASLTNLTSNTSYTFRAYVKVGTTKIYGTTKTFTTQIIPVAATVTTNDATDVGQTTATLNGLVNPGTDVIAERGFEWKLTTGGTYADEVSSSTGNTFTASLTNLTSNTSYTFRAYVKVGTTKIYGTTKTFTTQIIPVAATVTTNAASGIAQTLATLNGVVAPGTDVIAEKGFEWKLTTGGTYADEVSASTGNTFTASLTNLTSNTSYTFRAYVKVGTTKIYGSELTFTTSTAPVAATVTTNSASDIAQTLATLNGEVNPGTDVIAEKGFEWKLTTGGTYADEVSSSTGNTFTASLTNLTSNTSYTFRAYVKVGTTKIYGSELTFTTSTAPVVATVTTNAATYIIQNSATLNGEVIPGTDAIDERGFEWKETIGGTYNDLVLMDLTNTFSVQLPGLTAGTSYTFKAHVFAGGVRIYGSELTFTTLPEGINTSITTDDATDITAVSANLNATITPANDEVVTARGFEWKLTAGGTYSELYTAQTTDNYSVGINGLEANTSYTFKAFIMVNGNRIEGQEKVFVTLNGLNEVEGNVEIITIYPNPVSNTLYIECENEITKATLYDMNGRKIFEGENVSSIDASQLSKGIYSLRVVTNKSTRTFKVIKQ